MKKSKKKTKNIEIMDDKIIYTLIYDGKKDYLSYNEELFKILNFKELHPFRDDGRLRFNIKKGDYHNSIYLYDLAYACYKGMVKADSYIEDLTDFCCYKSANNLSVDHADNNVLNNTELNLSLMDKNLNSAKGTIAARVKYPYLLSSIYYKNEYRIRISVNPKSEFMLRFYDIEFVKEALNKASIKNADTRDCDIRIYFKCNNAEEYVDCLKWLVEIEPEWAEPIKKKGSWIRNDNVCLTANIIISLQLQKELSLIHDSKFNIHMKGGE